MADKCSKMYITSGKGKNNIRKKIFTVDKQDSICYTGVNK